MAKPIKIWNGSCSSFWFLPAIMVVSAALLSLGLTRLDIALGSERTRSLSWFFQIQADGARGLLSTVAG